VDVSSRGAEITPPDAAFLKALMGPIGLHGGGEYLPGDERFLDALLRAAAAEAATREDLLTTQRGDDVAGHRRGPTQVKVVILPTAAARGRPDRAGATGASAFERRAAALGMDVRVDVALVVDEASAEEPEFAALLASADLIHLSGGDPDIVPGLLDGSAAGLGLRTACMRNAVIGGASAGAMVLAEWSWTPQGGIHGLGFVRGLAVVPHYDDIRRLKWQVSLDRVAPAGLGYLGLDERTGVISGKAGWEVAGEGAAYWFAPGSTAPVVARDGERLTLPV
jgi:cyanophycinase-like exopeptidase